MKVSSESDNNIGYEQITIVVDNMPLKVNMFCCRVMLLIDNNLLLPGAKLHILNNIYRK
jgi:hypothetical protein